MLDAEEEEEEEEASDGGARNDAALSGCNDTLIFL